MMTILTPMVLGQPTEFKDIVPDTSGVGSAEKLTATSSLIAIGTFDDSLKSYPTKWTLPQGKLVHYVQKFTITKTLKGTSSVSIHLISTGIEPIPDKHNSLNRVYPGPFAENQKYIVFLNPLTNHPNYYTLKGVLQGIYPVFQDHTIAIEGVGFTELNDLTLQAFESKIKQLSRSSRELP